MRTTTPLDAAAIRAQLERVLAGPGFESSPALASFLRYVVEETLAGRADRIKGYTIAVHALGRPRDFDARADTIVRVQARRLRRALDHYYLTSGGDDPIRIEIPRGSYVPEMHERREALEGTTARLRRETSTQRSKGPSLVVLPFHTLADDEEQVYLADGLAQALVVALMSYPGFRIVGPLSRRRVAGQVGGPETIGWQYDGQFVLAGHFRRQGGRLRLTVRLVEVATGWTLWADTYDSQALAADLFSFEDQVANRIASAVLDAYGVVHRSLTPDALEKPRDKIEVYDALLRYYHFCTNYTNEARLAALDSLERAVALEPENTMALAMLADMVLVNYCIGLDEGALERAEVLTERALTLEPNSVWVRYVKASLYFVEGERELFLREVDQALATNRHVPAMTGMFGWYLVMVGEAERGLAMIEEALHLNPHVPTPYRLGLAMHYFRQGSYRQALVEAERIHAPGFFWGPLLRAAALGELGRRAEAQEAVRELLALQPDFARRGRRLMPRWVFADENVRLLADGLARAGLRLDQAE
jgi:adenylate cyclase